MLMRKYKGLFVLLSLMLVVGLFLTGCGNDSAQEPKTKVEQQSEQAKDQADQQDQAVEAKMVEEPLTKDLESLKFISSDEKPNGCLSCHAKTGDKDYSLTAELTLMNEKSGHPKMEVSGPKDCLTCHKDDKNSLGKAVHKAHLTGEGNVFVTNYGGSCVHCHALTTDNKIAVKGLTEGVQFTTIKSKSANLGKADCTACHVKTGDKDYSLTAELNNLNAEINHPKQEIQSGKDCLKCHADTTSLSAGLHKKHLTGENFATYYGASCRNCHAIYDNGEIKTKF